MIVSRLFSNAKAGPGPIRVEFLSILSIIPRMSTKKSEIIHVVPKLFPYGAYGMLSELHFAINKYWSDGFSQSIVNTDENGIGNHFDLPFTTKPVKDLGEYLKSNKGKVVFLHKLWGTDCTPYSEITNGVCPFVIVNHTHCTNCFGLSRCDAIVTVAESMYNSFRDKFKHLPVHFIRNGVNRCRYDSIAAFNPEQVKDYFVTGRLNNFNNVKHPLDWSDFCLVKTSLNRPMWHDYLGHGKHFDGAVKQARKRLKNKDGNVMHFPGRVDDFVTKVGYIKRWHVFLYEIPGSEGTSMSLLESMACGVPAIINNKPGNNEIVKDGVNGYVARNRSQMQSYLKSLATSDKKLQKLRKSTIDFFDKHLDARIMAGRYVGLAESLLRRHEK